MSPASAGPEDLDATAVIEAISDTSPRPGTAPRDPEATPAIDYPGEAVPAGKVPEPELAAQPHVRVDARLLEAALLNLRKRVASIPLVFEIAGAAEVKTERNKLLSQIDDYLLNQNPAP